MNGSRRRANYDLSKLKYGCKNNRELNNVEDKRNKNVNLERK